MVGSSQKERLSEGIDVKLVVRGNEIHKGA
jgi:hypothetical protein